MPFAISWYIPKRVLIEQFTGRIDLSEIQQIQHIFATYVDLGKSPVHLLVDLTELEDYPKSVTELKNAMMVMDNPNIGWVVIINQNPVLRFLASVLTQLSIANVRLRIFDNPESALKFLQERDPTLQLQVDYL